MPAASARMMPAVTSPWPPAPLSRTSHRLANARPPRRCDELGTGPRAALTGATFSHSSPPTRDGCRKHLCRLRAPRDGGPPRRVPCGRGGPLDELVVLADVFRFLFLD